MSQHTPIELLSDDDDDNNNNNNNDSFETPISNNNKRRRPNPNGDLLIIPLDDDDDPTPPSKILKSFASPPLIVPETPLSDFTNPRPRPSFPVDLELIDVESQGKDEKDLVKRTCPNNLEARSGFIGGKELEPILSVEEKQLNDGALQKWLDIDSMCYLHMTSPSIAHNNNGDTGKKRPLKDEGRFADSYVELDSGKSPVVEVKKNYQEKNGVSAVIECLDESPIIVQSTSEFDQDFNKRKTGLQSDFTAISEEHNKERAPNKNKAKDGKMRVMEEKKLKKEEEKLQKAALKAEAAKLKELEKEKKKLEKFKFSEKNILAKIDTKVIQLGKIGGYLVTKFGDKDLKFDLTSNPIEKSIIWRMTVPEGSPQLSSLATEIPYILLVYEADEFCKIVNDGSLFNHISSVQTHYPDYKICCLTNRLMSYINKRENDKYNNRKDSSDWKRPPVEEVLAKLATHFVNVNSRQCADEAELAEHVVGLTCNLAKCHSRKKLTHLSVNANGSNVPKDCVDRRLILKHPWLKALVSIPKVQPRFAIAIWKKYPNMKSLLRVYLDPTKSVHEKEFLLKDLQVEDLLGNGDKRLGEICSKRVYRILMAQNGSINADDAELGADFFTQKT